MRLWRRSRLLLAASAAEAMRRMSEDALPNETGGVLVGPQEGEPQVVSVAIGPGPRAVHGRSGFTRDGGYSQEELDHIHREAQGRLDYVGEWHSHPAPCGPSPTDRKSLAAVASDANSGTPQPLLVICTCQRSGEWAFQAFRYSGSRLRRLAVEIVATADEE